MDTSLDACWRLLRLMRSDPPRYASSGSRRRTFGAALDQSEELWKAARVVAPSARPIILYYALTQGARSICAARITGGDWEGKVGHGLTMPRPTIPEDQRPTVADIRVRDHGNGFFQQVARLLGSPTLPDECTLGELLCSLPDEQDFLLDTEDPRPLRVSEHDVPARADEKSDIASVFVGPVPQSLLRPRQDGNGLTLMEPPEPPEIANWLVRYPSLRALGEPIGVSYVNPMELDADPSFAAAVMWRMPEALDWSERLRYYSDLLDVPDNDGRAITTSGLVLPAVAGNPASMQPLVTWWAVLYVSSMLARYTPRTWAKLLDLDQSKHAVPVTTALEVAMTEVPRLIAGELVTAYSAHNGE